MPPFMSYESTKLRLDKFRFRGVCKIVKIPLSGEYPAVVSGATVRNFEGPGPSL